MKDSAALLNFNVNRDLKFEVFRQVDFRDEDGLNFDPNRELSFSSSRDLGFGKRGVVFRGYVCPVCKAQVARDAPRCDECGTEFQAQPAPKQRKEDHRVTRQSPPARPAVPPAKPRPTFQCPVCGRILYVGVASCPGCNARFASAETVPPPARAKPGTVQCSNCCNGIPPGDRFCRICGTPRPSSQFKDPSLERRV